MSTNDPESFVIDIDGTGSNGLTYAMIRKSESHSRWGPFCFAADGCRPQAGEVMIVRKRPMLFGLFGLKKQVVCYPDGGPCFDIRVY